MKKTVSALLLGIIIYCTPALAQAPPQEVGEIARQITLQYHYFQEVADTTIGYYTGDSLRELVFFFQKEDGSPLAGITVGLEGPLVQVPVSIGLYVFLWSFYFDEEGVGESLWVSRSGERQTRAYAAQLAEALETVVLPNLRTLWYKLHGIAPPEK